MQDRRPLAFALAFALAFIGQSLIGRSQQAPAASQGQQRLG